MRLCVKKEINYINIKLKLAPMDTVGRQGHKRCWSMMCFSMSNGLMKCVQDFMLATTSCM